MRVGEAGYGQGRSQAFRVGPQAQPDSMGSIEAYVTPQTPLESPASVLPRLSLAKKGAAWGSQAPLALLGARQLHHPRQPSRKYRCQHS